VIKYALEKQSPNALEEAYLIVKEINDPALKTQLYERIAECFVKIGCLLLKNPKYALTVGDHESILQPFERGLQIIKENIQSPQISLKIAGIIDIILFYSRTSNNTDYIIPLAMYVVEIENSYERDAMISRIILSLNDDIPYPTSTDPHEILAYYLQKNEIIKSNPVIIQLIYRIIKNINDPYIKMTKLSNLADSSIKFHDFKTAQHILEEICHNLSILPTDFHKVLILSDLATIFCQIDITTASKCLKQGIKLLDCVEFDKEALTRRQIVFSIVRLNVIKPDKEWIHIALQIVQKITEPVEYINSLIAIYSIVSQEKDRSNELIQYMAEAVGKISSPYEKASILLDIFPLALQSCDDDTPADLLVKAEAQTNKINIQSIADKIRDNIARFYSLLYGKYNDQKYLADAVRIIKSIDNAKTRLHRLKQMGYSENIEILPYYVKIMALSEKMIADGIHHSKIVSLERLVQSVPDRGREAIIFCDLSLSFRDRGEERLSRRMLESAIKEAQIIRPLSRRSFVMCDIALKIYAAGWEHDAQRIIDSAIDAATNIRQSSTRDEVFDELGLAIKLMQGL
jgi:hypothetical protein